MERGGGFEATHFHLPKRTEWNPLPTLPPCPVVQAWKLQGAELIASCVTARVASRCEGRLNLMPALAIEFAVRSNRSRDSLRCIGAVRCSEIDLEDLGDDELMTKARTSHG
jgi:hypothetical protein